MVQNEESNEEKDYILVGNPDLVKPLTMHLLATLERFEELEHKVEIVLDLLTELRNMRSRGRVKEYPKITLYFEQSKKDLSEAFPRPLNAEISFRWMKFTIDKIRNDEKALKALAQSIKTKFVKPLFYFEKGKKVGMYNNPSQGFNSTWSYFKDEANAKKVFESLLDLQTKSPDWECLNMSGSVLPSKAYPDLPNKVSVLGEQIREPRKRPIAKLYFRRAFIVIPPKKEPIYLVDVSNKKNALIYV